MRELIGKMIAQMWVSEDESILLFLHPDGTGTAYETDGDCCSETWFADIIGVGALLGATVKEADDVAMESVEDGRSRQDEDCFYGVKLKTDKGFADIVYRNSSNGYYGGSIGLLDDAKEVDISSFRQITADWSA